MHAVREIFHELSTTTATVELIEETLQALNRLCDEIAPYLAVLFSTASQRRRAFVEGLDTTDSWTVLVVDQSGALISTAGPDRHGVSDDGMLDETIRGWVRQALDERDLHLVVDPISERLDLGESGSVDLRLLPDPAGSHVIIMERVSAPRIDHDPLIGLSDRQADVITELVAGGTNDQIARRLGISVETVKKHLTSAYRVLGVSDRTSAGSPASSRHIDTPNTEP